jgi:hypothetical protein
MRSALFSQQVRVRKYASLNDYGEPVAASSGTLYNARIVPTLERVKNKEGEDWLTHYTVYIPSDCDVSMKDKIQMPDGTLFDVMEVKKFMGFHEVELTQVVV